MCTGIVGREGFERLGLPEVAVRATADRARFVSPAGVKVEYEPCEPMAYVVDRTRFDEALTARAGEAGALVLRGLEARDVEVDVGGVSLTCRRWADSAWNGSGHWAGSAGPADAEPEVLRARAIVIATGHRRRLHAAAGLGTPRDYVHGVHADLPFKDLEWVELYFGNRVSPGFFAWAVPFGDNTVRLGVLAAQGGRRHFRRFLATKPIRSRLGVKLENGGHPVVQQALRSRGIVQGPVLPSHADRVLAVGEAAGQVKTTTAGGIYYGMLGAELAGNVLHEGLRRDRLDAGFLQRYEKAWLARLLPEIESGFELQEAGRAMTDDEIDDLFRALRDGIASSVCKVVEFDWHRTALRLLFRKCGRWGFRGRVGSRGVVHPNR